MSEADISPDTPDAPTAPLVALRVEVATLRGTLEGVPRLMELFAAHGAGASFLFNLGPDHTGRRLPALVRRHGLGGALRRYGAALAYGTLRPGPDIGRRCADQLRAVRDAGFEVGLHAWDSAAWLGHAPGAEPAWTEQQMRRAVQGFEAVFGERPRVHGAPGWLMNRHALRLTQRLGFTHCADSRGSAPYRPVADGELIDCLQLPTTLPTVDELLDDGYTPDEVPERLLDLTARSDMEQVFTLSAEREGRALAPVLDQLLAGWRGQGRTLCTLRDLAERQQRPARHEVTLARPGEENPRMLQGEAFLGGL